MMRLVVYSLMILLGGIASAQPVMVPPDTYYRADAVCTSSVASRSGLAVTCGGVALNTDGMRVLLTAQTNGAENGPHFVRTGTWQQIRPTSANNVTVVVWGSDTAPGWWWMQQPGTSVNWGVTATTWVYGALPPVMALPGAVGLSQIAAGTITRQQVAALEGPSLLTGAGWLVSGATNALASAETSITGPMTSVGTLRKGRCKMPAALVTGRNIAVQVRKQVGSSWSDVTGATCTLTGGSTAECAFSVADTAALGDQYGVKVTPNLLGVISTTLWCALEITN